MIFLANNFAAFSKCVLKPHTKYIAVLPITNENKSRKPSEVENIVKFAERHSLLLFAIQRSIAMYTYRLYGFQTSRISIHACHEIVDTEAVK